MRLISLFLPGGRLRSVRRSRGSPPSDSPARQRGLDLLLASRRRFVRRKRLVVLALLALAYLTLHFLLPLQARPASPAATAALPGAASLPETIPTSDPLFCGSPAAVFAHFHLPASRIPGVGLLSQLPAPAAGGTANPPVTYDPASGRLCAAAASDLTALFLPPQSAGAGASVNTPSIDIDPVQWTLDALQTVEEKLVQTVHDWLSQQVNTVLHLGAPSGTANTAGPGPQLALQGQDAGQPCQAQSQNPATCTPAGLTYQNPTIQALNGWASAAVVGILALVLIIAGYNYMFRAYRHGWIEFGPKAVTCAVLAVFSLPLLGMAIDLINAAITDFQTRFGAFPPSVPNNPIGVDGVVFLIELVALLLLLLQLLVRLAILDLLLALAPLGIMCYALPQSRPWGRAWALATVSALVVQPLQLFAVGLGGLLISALGQSGTLVGALIGLGMFYVAWKLPGMLLSNALRAMSTVTRDTFSAIGAAADVVGDVFSAGEGTAKEAAAAVI